MTFDDYARQQSQESSFNPDAPFSQDPVGTTVDMMFND
jgi:hypothetical protein